MNLIALDFAGRLAKRRFSAQRSRLPGAPITAPQCPSDRRPRYLPPSLARAATAPPSSGTSTSACGRRL